MSKYPLEPLLTAVPADFTWMTGAWHGRRGENVIEEHWSGVAGNALMAMFRWLKTDGSVSFYELMVIEQEADGRIFLRVKHFYPGLKGWEEKDESVEGLLVALKDQKAVFQLVGKTDVWIVYQSPSPGRLLAYFEKEGEGVTEDDMFVYVLMP